MSRPRYAVFSAAWKAGSGDVRLEEGRRFEDSCLPTGLLERPGVVLIQLDVVRGIFRCDVLFLGRGAPCFRARLNGVRLGLRGARANRSLLSVSAFRVMRCELSSLQLRGCGVVYFGMLIGALQRGFVRARLAVCLA